MSDRYLVVMGSEIRGPMPLTDALALVRADPDRRFMHWAGAAGQKRPSVPGAWETHLSLAVIGAGGSEE